MKEAGYTAIAALIHFDCTAAGAAVLAELRPRPDQIERIDIATYRFASVMRNPDPPNYFASKYSLPHAAAVMVIRGNAGFLPNSTTRP
jgi:2-methylcitrate dehydratase PrpD